MTNPYAPPQTAVLDIVDVREGVVPADRVTRLGASILDGLIAAAMVLIPFFVGAVLAPYIMGRTERTELAVIPACALGGCGLIAWIWKTYQGVAQNGQSIAKKMLGIKVVRRDGSPASVGRIFWLRNVVNSLLGMIPLYGFVDALFIFADSRECLHDKLADTKVIKA